MNYTLMKHLLRNDSEMDGKKRREKKILDLVRVHQQLFSPSLSSSTNHPLKSVITEKYNPCCI